MKNKTNSSGISSQEKAALKDEIFRSIRAMKMRRRIRLYCSLGAAASFLVYISTWMYSNYRKEWVPPTIASALETRVDLGDDVVLLLDDGEPVVIEDEGSVIKYSQSGKTIQINDSKSIERGGKEETAFNTLMVPYGRRSTVTLSDGTRVWLNSGSKFVYPGTFSGETREVYLEGEAIFEVAENKEQPFLVTSVHHQIRVLGTQFNVSNYPDEPFINTVLKSGRVEIAYQSDDLFGRKKSIEMEPGTKTSYNKNSLEIATTEVNVERYFSWRDGVFVFKNDDLESIMKKLSRYYNVEIQIENESLKTERFSGYLDLRDRVEQVIRTIRETTSFSYTIEDNKIILDQN